MGPRRTYTNLAFGYLAPALFIMLICGVIPLGFVLFYSLHDSFAGNNFIWVGFQWFAQLLNSSEFYQALFRSVAFSLAVLVIELPLGILIALKLPKSGILANFYILIFAIPLLTPFVVVGYVWKLITLPQIGMLSNWVSWIGLSYDMNLISTSWLTLVLMDMWHWTSLVVLLCYAGLRAIPDDYYRAAEIDGASRWATFRYIELPKLRFVLLLAMLLRLMDSFIIYTEAYVLTKGGPGTSTTFLSHELVQTAIIQFDLGEGGAMSVIYFLIVLSVSWAFYSLIGGEVSRSGPHKEQSR